MQITYERDARQEQVVNPEISVIVPVYNCEHIVARSMEYIQRVLDHLSTDYELIVVDDGSTDNTSHTVKSYCVRDARVKLMSYSPNRGKGYAVKQGVQLSRGEKIVFVDGDMDIKPPLLQSYIDALEESDLVVASKYHPDSRVNAPLLRRILSLGFHSLVRLALRIEITDTQAGLKGGRAKAFRQIFSKVLVKRYAFDAEMLAVASLLNCRIAEMPIDIELNNHFRVNEMIRMFIDIAGVAYRLMVVKWYQRNLDNSDPQYRPIIPI